MALDEKERCEQYVKKTFRGKQIFSGAVIGYDHLNSRFVVILFQRGWLTRQIYV